MGGELRVESNFLTEVRRQFDGRRVVNASYSESAHVDLLCDRSSIAPLVSSSAAPISRISVLPASNLAMGGIYRLARTTQRFASLEDLRARPQFGSKQITNDQDYYGRARYPEITRSVISYAVELIEISHRE